MSQRTFRAQSYCVLTDALRSWSELPLNDLLARINSPAVSSVIEIEGEEITLVIAAHWANSKHDAVRIHGVASGASHWKIERIEESLTIHLHAGH